MAVERKYERDIDLLLAEELSVNPAFGSWLQSKTSFAGRAAEVIDVFVSKSDNLGESDLIALYESVDKSRFALMIEDKVDAPLQPDQAGRYRLRAEREVKVGAYSAYAVILCAPAFYLAKSTRAGEFDTIISFEDLAAFLRDNDPSRGRITELRSSKRLPSGVRITGFERWTPRPRPSGKPPTRWRQESFRSWK